ncbi:hypothetical protein B0A49_02935 [Cryomyces minteri]|uniref:Xylanolytic transcriptional activator regulatory domain-containing protein n=1 Tax=Cryomyces minteri TaxID=331657 RepID=A0A4U0XC70_9PEZI|nr:hypothetical protein B0A49_02935 [Cryomyces minteri]
MLELLKKKTLPHLEAAIQYVGLCYLSTSSSEAIRDSLDHALFHQSLPRDGFTVQTMLLFAIALHANDEADKASQVLHSAVTMALELGMNRQDFASDNGLGNPLMQESWRRTWWELYVVDGLIAAVSQSTSFELRDVTSDVPLPCEECEYVSSCLPYGYRSLEEYDNALFENDDVTYSSFTYRIDAVRILGKILAASQRDSFDLQSIDAIDALLVNWSLHLPASKRQPIGKDGQIDEMLFQARMIVGTSSILLHRPRSHLNFNSVQTVKACVSSREHLLPAQAREIHTAKALQAAEEVAKLITLPHPLGKHTHFFVCCVTMASVTFLSHWDSIIPFGDEIPIKEQIRLSIGALRAMENLWPVAGTALHQVKKVAQEIFAEKKASSNIYLDAITNDDIVQSMIENGLVSGPGAQQLS